MTSIPVQPNQKPSPLTAQAALQQIWGYPEFRPPQGEIVQCLLNQQDALVIMPTGGGKSVCFQLPALMQPGLTLVISPLVALMENQVKELHDRDRRFQHSVALLHGERSRSQQKQTLGALEHHTLRLLYLSPETLLKPAVWERLCQPTLPIHTLILDEAHCLSQWGDTFRPAYFRLSAVRTALQASKPPGTRIAIAAFTATADLLTQQTIQRILQLEHPQIFCQNPYRNNLQLNVRVIWSPRQRRQQLLQFIQTQSLRSGLVYVRTRRDSETLAEWLTGKGFQTAAYHAGLSPEQRRQIEQGWLSDRLQFVVCTNAFGMGVNKSAVRWVVHFHPPTLLSEYVQEVGRAGRDGKPAIALALISEPTGWLDAEDKQRRQFFTQQAQKQQRTARELAKTLPRQGNVTAISREFKEGAIALAILQSAGCLEWVDPFHYVIHQPAQIAQFDASNAIAAQQMTDYFKTRACRWQFLLNAFSVSKESQAFRCGQCDRCRDRHF